MSYINDALKKAQKERDSGSNRYMPDFTGTGTVSRPVNLKKYRYVLSVLFLAALFSGLWLPHFLQKNPGNFQSRTVEPENKVSDTPAKTETAVLNRHEPDTVSEKKVSPDPDTDENNMLYKEAVDLFRDGQLSGAKAIYEKILRKNPGHIKSLNDLGVLFLQERNYLQAENYLEKAVRLEPDNVNPYYNLACTHALKGDNNRAVLYLAKAVKLDSSVKDWIVQDEDLQGLRHMPEFTAILE